MKPHHQFRIRRAKSQPRRQFHRFLFGITQFHSDCKIERQAASLSAPAEAAAHTGKLHIVYSCNGPAATGEIARPETPKTEVTGFFGFYDVKLARMDAALQEKTCFIFPHEQTTHQNQPIPAHPCRTRRRGKHAQDEKTAVVFACGFPVLVFHHKRVMR